MKAASRRSSPAFPGLTQVVNSESKPSFHLKDYCKEVFAWLVSGKPVLALRVYQPVTLIFENEITARPAVGRPIDNAGRNVVKIRIFFTSGSTAPASSGCDRMR